MTKSELVENLARRIPQLSTKEVEDIVKTMLNGMTEAMVNSQRVEIRGFGSFSLHYREPRLGRNPKTGVKLKLDGKKVPHFKPGKELRERVNASYQQQQQTSVHISSEERF